jgi:predicted RNA-binding protein with PIN domain
MALLIDGYNLLHVTNIFGDPGSGTALHRTREKFLNFLAAALDERQRREATIVFDAAGAPPGLPRTIMHNGITVHFARQHSDADEMIEELIDATRAPRALLVVSSDHRVQRAARRRGATTVDSEAWYAELEAARREHAAQNQLPKPAEGPTPEETAYWVDQFADSASDDEPAGPFPPGYGDDVIEEER